LQEKIQRLGSSQTKTLCILGEMPISTVNRSQHQY